MDKVLGRAAVSGLHERIKAARTYAGLSQLVLSQRINPPVSRAAVALWESSNDSIRTVPDAEQVMQVAQACGVPPELLVDDAVAPTDILLLPKDASAVARLYARPGSTQAGQSSDTARRAALFWSTVSLQLGESDAALRSSFNVLLESHGVQVTVPYLHKRVMAFFLALEPGENQATFLSREVPPVLLAEAVLGKRVNKHLLVLMPQESDARLDGAVLFDCALGCRVVAFCTYQRAVEYLLGL